MCSEDASTLMSVPVALSHTAMRRPEAAAFHIEFLAYPDPVRRGCGTNYVY